jgi:hypothetical protein
MNWANMHSIYSAAHNTHRDSSEVDSVLLQHEYIPRRSNFLQQEAKRSIKTPGWLFCCCISIKKLSKISLDAAA